METPTSMEPIQEIGKYSLIEKLGEGSLGAVYRGFDPELSRPVVVRIFRNGKRWDSKTTELFFRESRSIAGLRHPNIAAIYEIGKRAQMPFMVIESLGGNTLESLIKRKPPITVESKLWIMIQIAEGLCHAHKKGILHLNLSPAKIHLTADGGIKIRDFALAHILVKHLSHPVVRYGMPIYLSPEKIQNKDCDQRSDVFSAGLMFYEFLTYFHPFHDKDGNKALDNILSAGDFPTFEEFPDVPPAFWPVLRTCLAKDPDARYQCMDEVLAVCKKLMKDMADDSRFMRAELHASLAPLRKAASKGEAPGELVRLSENAQKLLGSNEQADYVSLDRLMTGLLEQYPAIQQAAGELQEAEAELSWFPSKPFGSKDASELAKSSLETEITGSGMLVKKQPIPSLSLITEEATAEDNTVFPESSAVAEPPRPCSGNISSIEQDADAQDDGVELSEIRQAYKPPQIPDVDQELAFAEENAPSYSSLWIHRFYRRLILVLLAIVLITAAIYVALESGAATFLRGALTNQKFNSQIPAKLPALSHSSENASKASTTYNQQHDREGEITVSVLLSEARTLAAMNRFGESKMLLSRILEIDPACEEAGARLKEIEQLSKANSTDANGPVSQKQLLWLASLIESGELLRARTELDRLLQSKSDWVKTGTGASRNKTRNPGKSNGISQVTSE